LRENIDKKIEGLKSLIIMLERVVKLEKLEKNDKNVILAFMSQKKLRTESALDAKEAISRCNERISVYAKKIEMHEKRKSSPNRMQASNSIEEDSIRVSKAQKLWSIK
jgi:hypothetical protein